ncbi:peptidoglycan/LPS O-acetylase OafA/YrhL [Agromyces terreus]|uniref:Peptidoglycan/LPS O-acetylase OafA/YrhL n=1 Tax=Agromyces terreus TaxID=424795 RepID=A0A9X2H5E6_9MICO|nr:acyltransferase [Agromyces terreus]MCP2371117.1 peptidoglycan/LPS O-acetylase OafA/YrhL [Agromyces terreus]
MAGDTRDRRPTTIRPEVQALRAVAVAAVVLHHGWPAVAPAGYMGVDVFFVVSGFLITALLLREVERTGRISLSGFYLRRARRILPAAMVVLVAVSLLSVWLAPYRDWGPYFREILASAFYVENWRLAIDSQTAAFADLESTPVQHFWSLSVEEQFYLGWPLLILAALMLVRLSARRASVPSAPRRAEVAASAAPAPRPWRIRRVLAAVLGATTLASFLGSLVLTAVDHNLAYFSTLSRGWEFGVGGLLALAAASPGFAALARYGRLRAATSWIGLALIAVPIVSFHDVEAFPGLWVLLPVVGTLAVIWAGTPSPRWSTSTLAGLRPVQWLGDVSYSLYLWHWPIFMFTPMLLGMPSPPWLMVLLVGLSLAVSWASKRWIEDPFRRRSGPIGAHPRVIAAALTAALVGVIAMGAVAPQVADEICQSRRQAE